jgi:hypothetical protein
MDLVTGTNQSAICPCNGVPITQPRRITVLLYCLSITEAAIQYPVNLPIRSPIHLQGQQCFTSSLDAHAQYGCVQNSFFAESKHFINMRIINLWW